MHVREVPDHAIGRRGRETKVAIHEQRPIEAQGDDKAPRLAHLPKLTKGLLQYLCKYLGSSSSSPITRPIPAPR